MQALSQARPPLGAVPGQRQVPSSPCAGKWDLRGRSPSEQKQVGGHVVTWGSCQGHTRGRAVSREIGSLRCIHWRVRDSIIWMTAWGSAIVAWGGLAESWVPHNFRFLLKAEIWQLLLERMKESNRSVDEAGILGEASGRPELRVSPH